MNTAENTEGEMPQLSVIVCTYNRAHVLGNCLRSLETQQLAKRFFEVLIVNNNSTDTTVKVADVFIYQNAHFFLLEESKQGLSHARNCGWQAARGKYVAYIDDDAIADEKWCARILKTFAEVQPTPAAVGGPIYPYYTEEKPEWFLDAFEIRQWGDTAAFLEPPRAPLGFSGSNMAFARETLAHYGGFSSGFGMVGETIGVGEEAQFFYRLYRDRPYFWYDPQLLVRHWTPRRNMSAGYTFRRYAEIAVASIRIREGDLKSRRTLSYKLCKGIYYLLLRTGLLPFRLLFGSEAPRTVWFRYARKTGATVGGLRERFVKLWKF